jgi:hypothetical protein
MMVTVHHRWPPPHVSCAAHPYPLHRYWERQNPFSSLRALHLAPMLRHHHALFCQCSNARRHASSAMSWPSSCASVLLSTSVLILVQAPAVPRASHPPGCRRSGHGHLNADSRGQPQRCPAVNATSTPLAPCRSSAACPHHPC